MMNGNNYYYFISGLPEISPEKVPPLDPGSFIELCKSECDPKDHQELEKLMLWLQIQYPSVSGLSSGDGTRSQKMNFANKFVLQWTELIEAWDKYMVYMSGPERVSVEADTEKLEHHFRVVDFNKNILQKIFEAKDNEIKREKVKWQLLDEMSIHWPFGPEQIYTYLIKIFISTRILLIHQENGRKQFEKMLDVQVSSLASLLPNEWKVWLIEDEFIKTYSR